ncbi:hypothetical protein GCM10009550_08420 [Actinocorallia libanotica]|uniref:Uncharacterized protein n=1 Tax=Actinocorallia libanotica TaxID=46162 RepID=A0ABN1QAK0_9ACTN
MSAMASVGYIENGPSGDCLNSPGFRKFLPTAFVWRPDVRARLAKERTQLHKTLGEWGQDVDH